MRDFFSSHIRNPNTRRAYREAVRQFSAFCAEHGIVDLAQVEPVHVAAFVELQLKTQSKPTVKVRLAALRMLFDWMVAVRSYPRTPPMRYGDQNTHSVAAKRRCCRLTKPGP
jgi:site-specific recombinase XerD